MHFTDQLNRTIFISKPPQRIISLVPSQTELLVDLGLEERIVGVTKFCVYPKNIKRRKIIVGGTKNYRMEVIERLQPDLIIGNKEENEREGIEALMKKYPVWLSDICSVEDSFEMITGLGGLLGASMQAEQIVQQLKSDFSKPLPKKGSGIYLIWNDPVMAAGRGTFIDEMLEFAGFSNLVMTARYPELSQEELIGYNPDYLLLSSEPYPFGEPHRSFFQSLMPHSKIELVDGEMFSWYGSRLLHARKYLETLY